MPDGSVLVVGGWTPGHGSGGWGVVSRNTERWHPSSNHFSSAKPLPVGVATHQARWILSQKSWKLLVAGGNNSVVQSYDVANDRWQIAGEMCEPHEKKGANIVLPFEYDDGAYLWIKSDEACSCKGSRSDYENVYYDCSILLPLRLPGLSKTGSLRFDPLVGFLSYRADLFFVPGSENKPSYLLGGRVNGEDQDRVGGDALAIWPDGHVENAPLTSIPSPPMVDAELPPPIRQRVSSSSSRYERGDVKTKHLPDGRVIVAGGDVQVHKIALLTEKAVKTNNPDEYLGIGEYLPSRRHEIYEPATGAWRNSAPSRGSGGAVEIFDDGRVLKIGKTAEEYWKNADGREVYQPDQYVLEISSTDGNSWGPLDANEPPLVQLDRDARPFLIQGELFLSGRLPDARTGGGPDIVQWLNTSIHRWETLWEAGPKDNWRNHVGRIIIRDLANGKRVVLPVAGL